MKRPLLIFIILFLSIKIFAQEATISGTIIDETTKEALMGVHIHYGDSNNMQVGAVSDAKGNYSLRVNSGKIRIVFTYIGYNDFVRNLNLVENKTRIVDARMAHSNSMLGPAVVTAGKFEQSAADVTVTISVLKRDQIEANNTISIETALSKIPSVSLQDEQMSIRGGSGYSFGAGSRVLLLVDNIPRMEVATGETKWNSIPIENIEQVELIKGASSALFGSSAMNGVVNIRTAYPRLKPKTTFSITSGMYMNPKREYIKTWDDVAPTFNSVSFFHSRQIKKNFDLSFGGNLTNDQGYKEDMAKSWGRVSLNTRYRFKKIEGFLVGLNATYMKRNNEMFLLWADGDSGVYTPSPMYTNHTINNYLTIDPYLIYMKDENTKHELKMRYSKTINTVNTGQSNQFDNVYGDYSYQKHLKWKKDKVKTVITSGINANYCTSNSKIFVGENHTATNFAAYSQVDQRFGKLKISLGARWEAYNMSNEKFKYKPLIRSGLNYQVAKYTYLRASFGQGYRYPAIAERFIQTSAGGLNVLPNVDLKAEYGWSSEIGIRQGVKIGNFRGFLEIAGFWTEFHDMIEFAFGQHYPDGFVGPPTSDEFQQYTGFKAYNIGNARINGVEISFTGEGNIANSPFYLLVGYTYTNPVSLSDYETLGKPSTDSDMLKYRWYHTAKADFQMDFNKLSVGVSMEYNSNMVNIDFAFEDTVRYPNGSPYYNLTSGEPVMFLPGLKEYREEHNIGSLFFDFRIGYSFNDKNKLSLVCKNIFNTEYMTRPGNIMPPRNIALQYILKI